MSSKHSYDVIVIGAGIAGFSAAKAARLSGASVCLVEKQSLEDVFLNDTRILSKALLRSAKFFRSLQDAKRFGIAIGSLTFQFSDVMHYRQVISQQTETEKTNNSLLQQIKELDIDLVSGSARFEDGHVISVGSEQIYGKAVVVATGAIDYIPQITGLDAIHYLTQKDAFSRDRQSKSIAIIGGGPVACEIATLYSTFGTRVVLLQGGTQLMPEEDLECSQILEDRMKRLGIEIVTHANITEIVDGRGGVYGVKVLANGTTSMHAVEHVVVATGKRFQESDLGLEAIGVKCPGLGFIKTSNEQQTSLSHIFAAGDASGNDLFTYSAREEGFVAGSNAARLALNKRIQKKTTNERIVPHVTFVEPELASVGLSAEDVKKRFSRVLVGRCFYADLDRSRTDSEPVGLIKLIAHPTTHKILGGHIIGTGAGELIHEIALAIHLNATTEKLMSLTHAYPTFAEGIQRAATVMKME